MSTQEQEPSLEVSHFNNENLKVSVTKHPHCLVKFEISVQPKAVEAAYAKAIKNIRKEVSLPGFRKGKAPDRTIIEKFGPAIQKEWVDVVLNTAFNEAIQLTQLHPLKDGQIKRPIVHDCSLENGANFAIEFETRPLIPSVKPEELTVKRAQFSPLNDKDRQRAINQVAKQFTTYEPIEGRAAQEGDFVDVDVEIIEDDGQARKVIENQRTQVAEDGLPVWMIDKVVGLKVGESAEGQTQADPSQSAADFKSSPFRVTVNGLWKGTIPDIDDALAQRVGLQSVEQLKEKVNEQLEKETQENINSFELRELENALLQKYPIDLPGSLIDRNKRSRLNDYVSQLRGENQEEYLNHNRSQIESAVEQSTIQQLRLYFLLNKVAAEHHIEVTQEDINQELSHQISLISSGRSSIDYSDKDRLRDQIYMIALDRKVKQFLLDKAARV